MTGPKNLEIPGIRATPGLHYERAQKTSQARAVTGGL